MLMSFDPCSSNFNPAHRQCDFDREHGKVGVHRVHIRYQYSTVCDFDREHGKVRVHRVHRVHIYALCSNSTVGMYVTVYLIK